MSKFVFVGDCVGYSGGDKKVAILKLLGGAIRVLNVGDAGFVSITVKS